MLRYYGFVSRMADMAEKAKLAEQSPYKEQLEVGRKMVMAVAMMAEYTKTHEVEPGEVDKYFQEHKDEFTTANITVVQVPIKTPADTEGAKTLAANLLQQVAGGMDFGALAKQYPVDGDFKSIKKSDTSTPPDVKAMVFALKPGEITRPIVRANAVFLIRLDSLTVKTLQDARGDVLKTLQDTRYQTWMNGVRASVVIGK
jgi:parvulin-like peptidyl-prolyl isomerase